MTSGEKIHTETGRNSAYLESVIDLCIISTSHTIILSDTYSLVELSETIGRRLAGMTDPISTLRWIISRFSTVVWKTRAVLRFFSTLPIQSRPKTPGDTLALHSLLPIGIIPSTPLGRPMRLAASLR